MCSFRPPSFLLAAALAAALAAGCRPEDTRDGAPPVHDTLLTMGAAATITVPARNADLLPACTRNAAAILAEAEARLSVFVPDSDLARLNAAAGGDPVPVAPLTETLLRRSLDFSRLSDGAFDITVKPLLELWGFHAKASPPSLPAADAIADALTHVGYAHLSVSNGMASLDTAGVRVDPGGIGKGLAVDLCCEALRAAGVSNLMVNLSGNIRCFGRPRPAVRHWSIAVRNPFDRQDTVGVLPLTGGNAVATSGNYERFVTIDGRRYAHILDPRTGRPVEGMAGVTVIAPDALSADALSTTLFVLGIDQGTRLLERLPGCHALFIPDRRPLELWGTPGFLQQFTPNPDIEPALSTARPRP